MRITNVMTEDSFLGEQLLKVNVNFKIINFIVLS